MIEGRAKRAFVHCRIALLLAMAAMPALALVTGPGESDSLVPMGEPAPEVSLGALTGQQFSLSEQHGRTVVLVFGELYNQNTIDACRDLDAILDRARTSELDVRAMLIVSQDRTAEELTSAAEEHGIKLELLHDPSRGAFGRYRVRVLPSVVVVDPDGVTALASSGYPINFADMVSDALYYAAGRLTESEYRDRRETVGESARTEAEQRALRLSSLGEQLARQGSYELAASSFEDALTMDPRCIPALVGLGHVHLAKSELARAEGRFAAALKIESGSLEASLGLLQIQVVRGGEGLSEAHERVRELTREHPRDPRLAYLAGLIAERSGAIDEALGQYRRAAELSLYGQVRTWQSR